MPFHVAAQSCPGDKFTCSRCYYGDCFGVPVITYGNANPSLICVATTNSCSGICINPQEVVIYWEAQCDGEMYYGSGYTCCSY